MGSASLQVLAREYSRARKRETTQCNTAKLTQPRPDMAAPFRRHRAREYHWQELLQVSFCLSRQNTSFVWKLLFETKYLSRQQFCSPETCFATQAYFCRDKRRVLSRQKWYLWQLPPTIRENVVNLRVIIATAVIINLAMCYQHLTLIATLAVVLCMPPTAWLSMQREGLSHTSQRVRPGVSKLQTLYVCEWVCVCVYCTHLFSFFPLAFVSVNDLLILWFLVFVS